jgi:hypothetical protein
MSQENVEIVPVATSPLRGRIRKRGRMLTVTDPTDAVVVQAALGKAASPAYAKFETAGQSWRIDHGSSSAAVLDCNGDLVAKVLQGAIVLADNERLEWELSGLPLSCRIGDLWVARLGVMRERRFKAQLSPAMLAREDLGLLAGLASVLTFSAHRLRQGRGTAAGWFPI